MAGSVSRPAFQLAIIGGNPVAWMAALAIRQELERKKETARLFIVDNGPGFAFSRVEATPPVWHQMLRRSGLNEISFFCETGATLNYGSRYRGKREANLNYDVTFDNPQRICDQPPDYGDSWLDRYCISTGRPLSDLHLFSMLMARNRSGFLADGPDKFMAIADIAYGYHVESSLAVRFMQSAINEMPYIMASIEKIEQNAESGLIESLILEGGRRVPVDFVIDCTGACTGKLEGGQFSDWKPLAANPPANRVLPFSVKQDTNEGLPPYTTISALHCGWTWQMPMRRTIDCGLVYSSEELSDEEALAEVEAVSKQTIEPEAAFSFRPGYVMQPWKGNCLAVGPAQFVLEPLDPIIGQAPIAQITHFADSYLVPLIYGRKPDARTYNQTVALQMDDYCTLLKMRYSSYSVNSESWPKTQPDWYSQLEAARLTNWTMGTPQANDLFAFLASMEHIDVHHYYQVMDGLGMITPAVAKKQLARNPPIRAHARKSAKKLQRRFRILSNKALDHREFLNRLHVIHEGSTQR